MTVEPSREPSHTAPSSSACLVCGAALTASQRRYCRRACQQYAYRLRHQPLRPDLTLLRADLKRQRQLLQHTVYECPTCEIRSVGLQRCTECNTFARRIGLGGNCPECDAVLALTDLLGDEVAPSLFTKP